MERLLTAGYRIVFIPSFLCIICSIVYFSWHQTWDAVGLLVAVLVAGPFGLSMFLLPANLASSVVVSAAKKGWRLTTYLALFLSQIFLDGCCAFATIAIFFAVILKCAPTSHAWASIAAFGAATFPGCWIAFREREALGGILLAFTAGLASSVMLCALLAAPTSAIPAALGVYVLVGFVNFILAAPKIVPRKAKTAFDLVVFAMYGNPPPPNTADPTQAATLAAESLGDVVTIDEISGAAVRLNGTGMPFNTHELAVAVLTYFLRREDLMPHFLLAQMHARLAVVNWYREGKVNHIAAESFEHVIYADYQSVVANNKA